MVLGILRERQRRRERLVERDGSPPYRWVVPALAAAAAAAIHPVTSIPACAKYSPLDWLEIVNMETANALTLTINGQDLHSVPPSTVRTIEDTPLHHVAVTNNGGAVTTLGNVVVTIMRSPMTADRATRR